jgi:hypothetical protein
MFDDMVRAFGAEPVTVNSSDIYAALKSGTVDAQENPLAYMDLFKHYEVMKYVSMTNHMWSGFNMLAHQGTWNRIPADIRTVIERQVPKPVRLQRQDQQTANASSKAPRATADVQRGRHGALPRNSRACTSWKTLGASAGRCSKSKPAASPNATRTICERTLWRARTCARTRRYGAGAR